MKDEIKIEVDDCWNFRYHANDCKDLSWIRETCHYCGFGLDEIYCFIIEQLKEAGLLNKDYKLICCYCKILERFGLLDIRGSITSFMYDKENDIFTIEVSFKERFTKYKAIEWINMNINIHDYSKHARA